MFTCCITRTQAFTSWQLRDPNKIIILHVNKLTRSILMLTKVRMHARTHAPVDAYIQIFNLVQSDAPVLPSVTLKYYHNYVDISIP